MYKSGPEFRNANGDHETAEDSNSETRDGFELKALAHERFRSVVTNPSDCEVVTEDVFIHADAEVSTGDFDVAVVLMSGSNVDCRVESGGWSCAR